MSNPWIEPLPATTSPLPVFLAVLPDVADSKRCVHRCSHRTRTHAVRLRPSIRQKHLELSAHGYTTGWICAAVFLPAPEAMQYARAKHLSATVNGGPTFANTREGEERKMVGSWMLLRSASVEAARERLLRDVYATDGAWDVSRVR